MSWILLALAAVFVAWWFLEALAWWNTSPHPGATILNLLNITIPGLLASALAGIGMKLRFGVQVAIATLGTLLFLTALSNAALLQRNSEMIEVRRMTAPTS